LKPEDPENDTGILVAFLSQTIEESRRLREDLKQGPQDASAPEAPETGEDVTSPDPLSPPG
jgi:hypothetical protein